MDQPEKCVISNDAADLRTFLENSLQQLGQWKPTQSMEPLYILHHHLSSVEPCYFLAVDSEKQENVKSKLEAIYIRLGTKLYDIGTVAEFKGHEDIGYEEYDFDGVAEKADICMKCFYQIIKKLNENGQKKFEGEKYIEKIIVFWAVRGLCLSAEHLCDNLWTNEKSKTTAAQLQNAILDLCQCSSITQLLCDPPETYFHQKGLVRQILEHILPKLQKKNWKQNPSMKHVFTWCLSNIKFPYLSDYLDKCLPCTLLFVDDFQLDNKVIGVRCLQHIVDSVSGTELGWYGRAEVVYEALQHQLYTHEVALLDVLVPCLLSVLAVVQVTPTSTDQSRYDTILQRILSDMELENQLKLRRSYSQHLAPFLEAMGITVVRHIKRILKVVSMYLEIEDGPKETARLYTLDILQMTIKQAWPRMTYHCEDILKILLKFVYDVSTDENLTPQDLKDEMIKKAIECSLCLKRTSGGKVEHMLHNKEVFKVNPVCIEFIDVVLNTTI